MCLDYWDLRWLQQDMDICRELCFRAIIAINTKRFQHVMLTIILWNFITVVHMIPLTSTRLSSSPAVAEQRLYARQISAPTTSLASTTSIILISMSILRHRTGNTSWPGNLQ